MIYENPQDDGSRGNRATRVLEPDANGADTSDWIQLQQALAHVCDLTGQLEKHISTLPNLATHDHIYPEMEERYAIKEEIEKELSEAAVKLGGLFIQLERRVDCYRRNLERIGADVTKLNHPELQPDYSQAQEAARKQYAEGLRYRDRMAVALTKARSVLEVARRKKFPDRKPHRQTPPGPNESGPGRVSQTASTGTSDGQKDGEETDGLISLGPLPAPSQGTH
jgi:hypothetical protein